MCYDNIGICINYIELTNLNVIYIYSDWVWMEFHIKLSNIAFYSL
jgi:hypothetical protein